jgi:hypothetical protein
VRHPRGECLQRFILHDPVRRPVATHARSGFRGRAVQLADRAARDAPSFRRRRGAEQLAHLQRTVIDAQRHMVPVGHLLLDVRAERDVVNLPARDVYPPQLAAAGEGEGFSPA